MVRHPSFPRRGFTLAEVGIALAILAGAAVLVVQLTTWVLAERARTDARLEATDAAANLLEQARARPWDDLTDEWAKAQRLPDHLAARWPEGKLAVRVEPERDRPRVKRVTVEVRWDRSDPVTMTALFAARTAGGDK
jgi:prepilin-type N-terminal cleavage/methylation domain-containing protein